MMCRCLSYLPTAVGSDPAHFDLSLARKQSAKGRTSPGDWLVLRLQELVSLAYQVWPSEPCPVIFVLGNRVLLDLLNNPSPDNWCMFLRVSDKHWSIWRHAVHRRGTFKYHHGEGIAFPGKMLLLMPLIQLITVFSGCLNFLLCAWVLLHN